MIERPPRRAARTAIRVWPETEAAAPISEYHPIIAPRIAVGKSSVPNELPPTCPALRPAVKQQYVSSIHSQGRGKCAGGSQQQASAPRAVIRLDTKIVGLRP